MKKSEYAHKKIKEIREEKRLTQEFMAYHLSISPAAYQKIESGKTQMTVDHLEDIVLALKEPMETFLALDTKVAITNPFSQNISSTITGNSILVNTLPSNEQAHYENQLQSQKQTIEMQNSMIIKLLDKMDKSK